MPRSFAALWITLGAIVCLAALYAIVRVLAETRPTSRDFVQFHLAVHAPRRGDEYPVYTVAQGEQVSFVFSSEIAGEVHLHGYEMMTVLRPGGTVTLSLDAIQAGRFPLHLHDPDGSMHHLATLEVQPK